MNCNIEKAFGLCKPGDVVFRSPETSERSFEVRARPRARARRFAASSRRTTPEPPCRCPAGRRTGLSRALPLSHHANRHLLLARPAAGAARAPTRPARSSARTPRCSPATAAPAAPGSRSAAPTARARACTRAARRATRCSSGPPSSGSPPPRHRALRPLNLRPTRSPRRGFPPPRAAPRPRRRRQPEPPEGAASASAPPAPGTTTSSRCARLAELALAALASRLPATRSPRSARSGSSTMTTATRSRNLKMLESMVARAPGHAARGLAAAAADDDRPRALQRDDRLRRAAVVIVLFASSSSSRALRHAGRPKSHAARVGRLLRVVGRAGWPLGSPPIGANYDEDRRAPRNVCGERRLDVRGGAATLVTTLGARFSPDRGRRERRGGPRARRVVAALRQQCERGAGARGRRRRWLRESAPRRRRRAERGGRLRVVIRASITGPTKLRPFNSPGRSTCASARGSAAPVRAEERDRALRRRGRRRAADGGRRRRRRALSPRRPAWRRRRSASPPRRRVPAPRGRREDALPSGTSARRASCCEFATSACRSWTSE